MAPENISLIIASLEDVYASRYIAVAAFTFCVYDWLLLFGDEWELVGKSRLSLGKILYYFSRIMTPIGLASALYHLSPFRGELSEHFCVIFTFFCPMLEVICILCSYWLLMLRLVALYKSKPILVWLLYGGLVASYGATIGLLLCAQLYFSDYLIYSDIIGMCVTTGRSSTLSAVFYAPLAFDLLLFSLTIYHAWKDYRLQSDPAVLPLLRVMYRDGAMFCGIMVAVRIWNIVITAIQPLTRTYMGAYLMWSVITVLCSRIYLNVVQIARSKTHERPRSYSSPISNKGQYSWSTPTNSPSNYSSPSVEFPPNRFRRDDYQYPPDHHYTTPCLPHRQFPYVVGRPLPIIREPTPTAPPGTADSKHYYSTYFRDQFPLDQLSVHEKNPDVVPGFV